VIQIRDLEALSVAHERDHTSIILRSDAVF
jgi:hypothetical protein